MNEFCTILWVVEAYNGTSGYTYSSGSVRVLSKEVDETIEFLKESVNHGKIRIEVLT
ncbi:hypothetical protein [Erwinia phage FBB1]|nr:hypothetical protein [Erwinia phage FBB1]